jgi:preprotein translocase subunit SecD
MEIKKEGAWIKTKDLLKNWRIWILLLLLFFSFIWFDYDFGYKQGIVISSVAIGSISESEGFEVPTNINLKSLERIISVDDVQIKTEEEFFNTINTINKNEFKIKTNKKTYRVSNFLNLTNNNKTRAENLGLSFRDAPKSNLKLGIELEGGTRIILKAKNESLTEAEFEDLIEVIEQRLSKGGLSGTKVKKIEDAFSNDKFILVESTSSNKNQIFDLMKRQGLFEAKINNVTVFTGEDVAIIGPTTNPPNSAPCSNEDVDNFVCHYAFGITLDEKGTNGFFNQTSKLNVIGDHLSSNIYFYLDNNYIVDMGIGTSFKSSKSSNAVITIGGDSKSTQKKASEDALKEVDRLKIILQTGPLPSELEVVSTYTVSSSLSEEFLSNALLIGLLSLFIVSLIVAVRYRKPIIFAGVFTALITEIIIIFGISSLMSWAITIDLVAIGGLIASIGTGVDDQIIINDEYFRKKEKDKTSKKKIRKALVIIMMAYLTTIAAMLPLSFAGLELIKGFSIMIVLGVTIGVFVTRPAYATFLRILTTTRKERLEEEKE